jgi:hypothetical protein
VSTASNNRTACVITSSSLLSAERASNDWRARTTATRWSPLVVSNSRTASSPTLPALASESACSLNTSDVVIRSPLPRIARSGFTTRQRQDHVAKESGGPRRTKPCASLDVAIDDAGRGTSSVSCMSAERVPASTEMTAGIASGCPLRRTAGVVAGRSDAIAASTVVGAIRTSTGARAENPASVCDNANDAIAQTNTTRINVMTTLRGWASSVLIRWSVGVSPTSRNPLTRGPTRIDGSRQPAATTPAS